MTELVSVIELNFLKSPLIVILTKQIRCNALIMGIGVQLDFVTLAG